VFLFTVEWEGPEAVEEVEPEEEPSPVPDAVAESLASEPNDVASEADSADSGDEYFLEADKVKGPGRKVHPSFNQDQPYTNEFSASHSEGVNIIGVLCQ
jgi:hypothetical protein